jgi:pimeloyl-ACP methyl ester carboxylesterase
LKNLIDIAPRVLRTPFSNGDICWKVFGNGTKIMLAFHGFGQTGEAFLPIFNALPNLTIYAMDLPFHGATAILDKNIPLEPSHVEEILDNLIKQEQIDQFSIIGFSIGAKLIFPLFQKFAPHIQGVTLIAPDGIKENFWYRLATGSKLMRGVFKQVLQKNQTTNIMLSYARSFGLISSKTSTFVKASLNNQDRKNKVYDTWCYLRKLKADNKQVSMTINNHSICLDFVVGDNDHIIPIKSIADLSGRIENKNIIRLKGGHYDLIRNYAESLSSKGVKKS